MWKNSERDCVHLQVFVSLNSIYICDPMGYSPPGSSIHGILHVRIPEWVAISFSRDLPNQRIEPTSPIAYFYHLSYRRYSVTFTDRINSTAIILKYNFSNQFTIFASVKHLNNWRSHISFSDWPSAESDKMWKLYNFMKPQHLSSWLFQHLYYPLAY